MNTPAHLIFGAAAFGRPGRPAVTSAALLGGLAPDLSLYLMVAWARSVGDVPARTIFGEYYFSDAWMSVFAVDNSFPIWGALLALAIWRRWPVLIAFAGAGLLHLALDLPLHGADARPMFWPLSDWRFVSPLSYWDRSHHAGIIGPLEAGLSVVLTSFMLWRFRSLVLRAGLVLLLVAELGSSGIWRFVF
ncbi:cobalamin biosynthesis protein CobQ [Limimaricola sp. AA108-03]|uniref:cobalamin biosynthesis protein CobQ n=1 Tax=Limimaricola sp. AA108-03 TaxID=3425945 RepID=UPI003D76C4FA